MPIDALAAYPSTQRPGTFASEMDSHIGSMPAFIAQANALEVAADAAASTASAAAIAASESAATAAAAATAAQNYSNAALWVTGTTYAIGNVRISPITFTPWIRTTAGAGSADPSLDPTNWKTAKADAYGGSDTTSSATDITLTSASKRLQAIAMTASAKSVTLPNATTLMTGVVLFAIKNTGSYAFAVRTNGGALLCVVNPGNVAALHLSSNASAAGVWAVGDELVGAALGSIWQGVNTTIAVTSSSAISVTSVTPQQVILVWSDSVSNLKACTLNMSGTTVTAGAVLVVEAGFNAAHVCVAAMTDNPDVSGALATLVYTKASTGVYARTLSVSGTTLTAGDALTVSSTVGCSYLNLVALSSIKAVVAYNEGGYVKSYVLSVSGTTVTEGTAYAPGSPVNFIQMVKLSATQLLIRRNESNYAYYRTLDVSGTSISGGTEISYVSPASTATTMTSLSASRVLLTERDADTSSQFYAVNLLNIAGTTVTRVSTKPLALGAYPAGFHAVALSANKVVVSFVNLALQNMTLIIKVFGDDIFVSDGASHGAGQSLTRLSKTAGNTALLLSQNTSSYPLASILEIAP